jgi:hypothetical protein
MSIEAYHPPGGLSSDCSHIVPSPRICGNGSSRRLRFSRIGPEVCPECVETLSLLSAYGIDPAALQRNNLD